MKMKVYDKKLIEAVNDYADEEGIEEVLDRVFPGATIGEIVVDMYNAGLIPEDVMERFLEDE